MPSPSTTNFPRPKSWDEFEDICADILKKVWRDPYLVRNGRAGQKQHGVDIYGYPEHLGGRVSGKLAGAQCKNTETLDSDTVSDEVTKAKSFKPPLTEYIVMTAAPRDESLQEFVRTTTWPFHVQVLAWEDICLELSGHDDLLKKHFPGWMKKTTTRDDVIAMISASSPEEWTYDDSTGIYYLNRDIKLRIIIDRSDEGGHPFDEPWVKRFPDPKGERQMVYVHYEDTRVLDFVFVWVDGFRYLLPIPKSITNLTISHFKYHLGSIIGAAIPGYGFDFGLQRAGIIVQGDEE